jgi:hypothetical protein
MATSKTILFRIVAVLTVLAVTVLVAGFWWASSLYQSEQADSARAAEAFAQVRARFPGVEPAFAIREARLLVARAPAPVDSSAAPVAAHLLVWQSQTRTLSRVTLPLWMSKVATEPLPLEALAGIGDQGFGAVLEAKRRGDELNIRISDLERYGRTLLLDGVTADGKQVMIWNE